MTAFKNYMTLLSAFIFTGSIIMSMIPAGSIKKTVKFIISLILMAVILSPIPKLKNIDISLNADEYISNNEINAKESEYAISRVEEAVNAAIEELAVRKGISIKETEVETENGRIKGIIVDKALADYISDISEITGIPKEYVKLTE